jgi:uncharacterized phage protein (TIGR02220 family)
MRIRTIKPEWLQDERLAGLSDAARTLSISLILLADDYGNGRANEMFIAAQVWAYSGDSIASVSRKTRECLESLSDIGFVDLYEVRGQKYYSIRNWGKHQRVDRPSKPHVPGPEESEGLASGSRGLHDSLNADQDQDQDQDQDRKALRASTSRVIGELNKLTGKNFKCTADSNLELINARLGEGYTEADLLSVVRDRVRRWKDDEKMSEYLRPGTLFRKSKFADYVGEAGASTGSEDYLRQQLAEMSARSEGDW